jgi:tetratricopeptide (TPR) repeat protein
MPVLDPPAPLSASKLWRWQRAFYEREGVDAWAGKIPFYITSNPAIADSYAQILVRLQQDWARTEAGAAADPAEPFVIVELGTGHGAFGFHAVQRLVELRLALGLAHLPFVYVMTDFVERNLEHARAHPSLAPFIAAGTLDFARFDVDGSDELVLLGSGRRLGRDRPARRPLAVVANYVFDTVPQDYYRVHDGALEEGLVELSTPADNLDGDRPISLAQVTPSFSYRRARRPCYDDEPALDAVLAGQLAGLVEAHVLLPVGALRCLERLAAMAGAGLALLVSDKGYLRHTAHFQEQVPGLAYHDESFSLPLPFDALGRWIEARGGEVRAQVQERELVTAVFLDGLAFDHLPETRLAVAQLDTAGYANVYPLVGHAMTTRAAIDAGLLATMLAASRWDARLWSELLPTMLEHARAGRMSGRVVADLTIAAERVAERYYPLRGGPDAFHDLARFFHELGQHARAAGYYERSLALAPERAETHVQLGVCRYYLADLAPAAAHFTEAVRLEPRNVTARGWLAQLAADGWTAA